MGEGGVIQGFKKFILFVYVLLNSFTLYVYPLPIYCPCNHKLEYGRDCIWNI